MVETHQVHVGVFMISSFFVVFIYVPLICFWIFQFAKIRDAPYLRNRYPMLTIKTNASVIIFLLAGVSNGVIYIKTGKQEGFIILPLFFIFFSTSLFIHTLTARIWLLYYDIKFAKATLNDEWERIINPHQKTELETICETNAFYLANRSTLGNYQWVTARFQKFLLFDVIFLVILFTLCALLVYLGGVDHHIVGIIWFSFMSIFVFCTFILPTIYLVIIYRMIPDFYDHLGLRDELRWLLILLFASYFLFILIFAGYSMEQVGGNVSSSDPTTMYYFAILSQLSSIVSFMASYSMLKYYPNKLKNISDGNIGSGSPSSKSISMFAVKKQIINHNSDFQLMQNHKTDRNGIKLQDILFNNKCFEVFIEHLAHEFCHEGLLAVIEFTHYRDHILYNEIELQKHYKYNKKQKHSELQKSDTISVSVSTSNTMTSTLNINNEFYNYSKLSEKIVKSDIVYPKYYHQNKDNPRCCNKELFLAEYMKKNKIDKKFDRITKYKEMAHSIFDKYVRTGAEFEINIAYAVRMKYMQLMRNKTIWITADDINETTLCSLFDDCYDEMIKLMAQSFTRFKRTDQFRKVSQIINK